MMHLRTEYRDYVTDCKAGGEIPLDFRTFIWIAYSYESLDEYGFYI